VCKFAVLGTMLAIGFERWKVTRLIQRQLQPPESTILSIVSIVIIWLVSLSLFGFLVPGSSPGESIDYCNTLFVYNPTSILLVSGVLITLEVSAVVVFGYIWFGVVKNWCDAFGTGLRYNLNDRLINIPKLVRFKEFKSSFSHTGSING